IGRQQVVPDLLVVRVVGQVLLEGLDRRVGVLLVVRAFVPRLEQRQRRQAHRAPGEGDAGIQLKPLLELLQGLPVGLLLVQRIALLQLGAGLDLVATGQQGRGQKKGEKHGSRLVHFFTSPPLTWGHLRFGSRNELTKFPPPVSAGHRRVSADRRGSRKRAWTPAVPVVLTGGRDAPVERSFAWVGPKAG